MNKHLRPILIFVFISCVGVGGLVLGAFTSKSVVAVAKERYAELQLFAKVLSLVQKYYVEDIEIRKLLEGGIKGMLRELDPHSNYLPPDIYKEFENETTGEFGGLGIEITVKKSVLTIISPIEDTPAWKAGLKAGDQVVGVNGTATKGLSLVESAQLMRGKIGSDVILSIMRDDFKEPKDFTITRGIVKIRSVKPTDLGNGYLFLRITSFIENTSKDLNKVLAKAEKDAKIRGLIIDLRRNPGGLLDQAVKVSDLFLEKGTIVSTIGRNERDKDTVFAKKAGTRSEFPIIVLMNEFSASASEIVAGALQDNKRALIMGQRSFGKGSVQSVIKLGDGSGLKLTVARYYTPSGRSIQAEGIKPDVIIENIDTEALKNAVVKGSIKREQDIAGHLQGEKEKAKAKAKSNGKEIKDLSGTDSPLYWWNIAQSKNVKDLTKKEKLLSRDYQALQAYNYLKAWRVMRGFEGTTTQ